MKDFRSFAERDAADQEGAPGSGQQAKSTIVLVDRLDVVEDGALVLVVIEGSHFLWKMVRRIVGVLVEIGRGGLDASVVHELMGDESAVPAKLTAPPSGLFLERVYYRNDRRDAPIRALTPLS
jgi:tRNA pseudouridine38-40 synthase